MAMGETGFFVDSSESGSESSSGSNLIRRGFGSPYPKQNTAGGVEIPQPEYPFLAITQVLLSQHELEEVAVIVTE